MSHSATWDNLQWAYSPCPNDTFIFGALAGGKLPNTHSIPEPQLLDIEQLNTLAQQGSADVIKVSAALYAEVQESYQILPAGSALGYGVGPLLVARQPIVVTPECSVAIPGRKTTANMLLSCFYPHLERREPVLFSEIEGAVQRGEYDLGLLIHEGRFTYQERGLVKIADMGQLWEARYGIPIPLGVICIRRTLPEPLKREVAEAIRASLLYARAHPDDIWPYVRQHAQVMDDSVMHSHIALYVNDFSLELGPAGRSAICALTGIREEGAFV